MPDGVKNKLNSYFSRGRNGVTGWLGRIDAEIFRTLLNYQASLALRGSIAEIGVHHGKSFIGLCLALQEGERAYCVDLFENQHLKIDESGAGNRQVFEENLRRFGIDFARLTVRTATSLDVAASEIVDDVGPIRFFSIDGGHWAPIVEHDLTMAQESVADYGVVALDDFCRPEWPNVSAGYFSWAFSGKQLLVPLCIGVNKLYLCHEGWREPYQDLILNDEFLRHFLVKMVDLQGVILPNFNEFVLEDSGLFGRLRSLLRLFHPEAYVRLRRLLRVTRGLLGARGALDGG